MRAIRISMHKFGLMSNSRARSMCSVCKLFGRVFRRMFIRRRLKALARCWSLVLTLLAWRCLMWATWLWWLIILVRRRCLWFISVFRVVFGLCICLVGYRRSLTSRLLSRTKMLVRILRSRSGRFPLRFVNRALMVLVIYLSRVLLVLVKKCGRRVRWAIGIVLLSRM